MNICVISTNVIPCPPPGYAGLEQLAYQQAVGLANLGHKVLLVAPKQSTIPSNVELHGTTLMEPEKMAYSGYWQRLLDFDVIIDNSWEKWSYILKMEGKLRNPILGVLHAPPTTMYRIPPPVEKPCFIAISKDQSEEAKAHLKIDVQVAYNGVDPNFYKSNFKHRMNKWLFLARMCRIKGPHIAVAVANEFGLNLDLVGDDTITGEPDYANELKKASAQNSKIIYHGPVNRDKAVDFFSTRKCLLHMNQMYREPFGLAPVEAQMCGMPVIAWDNGAMRETVKHGKTGFLVRSIDEVRHLVKSNAVEAINPEECRKWAMQFSVENMIHRYNELCNLAVKTGGW